MSKRTDIWMPFYTADYTRDTLHLSRDQHGGYILLLIACWNSGGRLLNDGGTLAGITKSTPQEWRRLSPVLKAFFRVEGKYLIHKRVIEELEKAAALSDKRRGAGAKGAEGRWGVGVEPSTRSDRLAQARKLGVHTAAEWDALVDVLGSKCVRCATPAEDLGGAALCKDHIKPIYQGGSDSIENLQPLCRNCNASKGADDSDLRANACQDWRQRLAKRLANASQTSAHARVTVTIPTSEDNHLPSQEGSGDSQGSSSGAEIIPLGRDAAR